MSPATSVISMLTPTKSAAPSAGSCAMRSMPARRYTIALAGMVHIQATSTPIAPAAGLYLSALRFGAEPPEVQKLIYDIIR